VEQFVTVRPSISRGALPRAVLLASSVALLSLPVAAADGAPTPKTPSLEASMARIVARDLRTAIAAPAVKAAAAQGADNSSPAFFKTRVGLVVAAVMVAGTGYALYSAQHDRIHSAGKK
jgi:hypothetical protein